MPVVSGQPVRPDSKELLLLRRELIMTVTMHPATLSATDRCDGCGAQAYVRVELVDGAELLFCGHHARQHEDKLREVAIRIHDETRLLLH